MITAKAMIFNLLVILGTYYAFPHFVSFDNFLSGLLTVIIFCIFVAHATIFSIMLIIHAIHVHETNLQKEIKLSNSNRMHSNIEKPKKVSLEIEKILKDIDIVTQSIYSFDFIKNDQYYMSEIDSMIKNYMPKILDNYFAVPETLRNSTFINQLNITQQTMKQLEVLLKQLKKIEKECAVYQSQHIKAMDRFLKHRFPKELVSLEINS